MTPSSSFLGLILILIVYVIVHVIVIQDGDERPSQGIQSATSPDCCVEGFFAG